MPNSLSHPPAVRVRFPLSAKILFWFLLNLAFLAAAGWLFAGAQLRLGLDSLIGGPVNDRLQTMATVLTGQLDNRPPGDWAEILKSTGEAYRVQLGLFRNDGRKLTGELDLPKAVNTRLIDLRDARPRQGPPGQGHDGAPQHQGPRREGDDGNQPPPGGMNPDGQPFRGDQRPMPPPPPPPRREDDGSPPPRDGGAPPAIQGGFPKMMLHTTDPGTYWVLIRLPIVDRQSRPPMPITLVLASNTLSAGGLLFDFKPWLIGGGAVLLVSMLLWLPLVAGITRALRQMTGAAEAIAQGRFETEVTTRRADELGRLGGALNHMSARLQEFFTGQKRFLGDIAHELCSPLARMEMALGILDQRADEKQRTYVADVREELRHMSTLVNELLSFSKAGVGAKNVVLKAVPLAEMAGRVMVREAREKGIVVDIPLSLAVQAEPDLLARALGNVIRNAIRYANPTGASSDDFSYRPSVDLRGRPTGPITIAAREQGESVVLTVTDCGPGVPEETLHRLFDPFFRPESARSRETGGTGLGLAIVKSCVEACGGTVAVRNVLPHGLQVTFTLRSV